MVRHVEHGGVPGLVTVVSRRGETHVDAVGVKARARPGWRSGPARVAAADHVDVGSGTWATAIR